MRNSNVRQFCKKIYSMLKELGVQQRQTQTKKNQLFDVTTYVIFTILCSKSDKINSTKANKRFQKAIKIQQSA